MNSMGAMIALQVFGGLGLFLYGMTLMSEGLEKAAGNKLKQIIEALTRNRIVAVVVGAAVTMVVQSSSATTVMVVGFVNAGIMNLTQAIGIIMGANIGTTVTAQLVSINLTALAPVTIGIGVVIKLFSKNSSLKKYADIFIGFGILFLGMDTMKHAMKPLREYEGFTTLLTSFGSGRLIDTALAIFTGFAITAIVQSSSATTGILVALAGSGLLNIYAAFPILLGTNIGTCVTAMISSIGASKTAKRAALMHLLFNVMGTLIFIILLAGPTIKLVTYLDSNSARQLANAHTIFNIANTLLLLPFAGLIVKMVEKIIPETEEEEIEEIKGIKYLDDRILETPSIALLQVTKEILHMGNLAKLSYANAMNSFMNNDIKLAKETFKIEEVINLMEREITEYLVKLSNTSVSQNSRERIDGLFSTINDIERVGDHADNIAELSIEKGEKFLAFSDSAIEELKDMSEKTILSFSDSLTCLKEADIKLAQKIIEREGEIDVLEKTLRKKHIKRLSERKCQANSGVIFLDIISNLERIGDHASNIAYAVIYE
ncbi:Na/Pi cotransporter family protein [Helicovermis profundi]|uniref:Na/Pi cotransporter family protein n=1 Tax=Helicovermis profundi TaxID=3065157 RepID=A0AAU9E2Z6_9FIRM|nr:Na/Pi cotransporter family protein [Clostridia bacterium S502]